ncbi:phospholipase A2-like, partial [Micropterus salmoides]|uniref:phospholipase A2-like n=1 Tax=Micropterus salmoides TaxID=27706 RepID=UPI0018EB8C23
TFSGDEINLVQFVSDFVLSDFLTRRCWQVHDQCYVDATQHPECWPIFDNPYIEFYDYSCSMNSMTTTRKIGRSPVAVRMVVGLLVKRVLSALSSSDKNDTCEMFICEYDRKAAECFASSPWIPEHEHLSSNRCR